MVPVLSAGRAYLRSLLSASQGLHDNEQTVAATQGRFTESSTTKRGENVSLPCKELSQSETAAVWWTQNKTQRKNYRREKKNLFRAETCCRGTYSTMASRSAMSPSTMRWMMELCSSSERFLWDTRGVLNLVAGDGSTPCSHAWLSISSSEARCLGSLCSIRFIRLLGGKDHIPRYVSGHANLF